MVETFFAHIYVGTHMSVQKIHTHTQLHTNTHTEYLIKVFILISALNLNFYKISFIEN